MQAFRRNLITANAGASIPEPLHILELPAFSQLLLSLQDFYDPRLTVPGSTSLSYGIGSG